MSGPRVRASGASRLSKPPPSAMLLSLPKGRQGRPPGPKNPRSSTQTGSSLPAPHVLRRELRLSPPWSSYPRSALRRCWRRSCNRGRRQARRPVAGAAAPAAGHRSRHQHQLVGDLASGWLMLLSGRASRAVSEVVRRPTSPTSSARRPAPGPPRGRGGPPHRESGRSAHTTAGRCLGRWASSRFEQGPSAGEGHAPQVVVARGKPSPSTSRPAARHAVAPAVRDGSPSTGESPGVPAR